MLCCFGEHLLSLRVICHYRAVIEVHIIMLQCPNKSWAKANQAVISHIFFQPADIGCFALMSAYIDLPNQFGASAHGSVTVFGNEYMSLPRLLHVRDKSIIPACVHQFNATLGRRAF